MPCAWWLRLLLSPITIFCPQMSKWHLSSFFALVWEMDLFSSVLGDPTNPLLYRDKKISWNRLQKTFLNFCSSCILIWIFLQYVALGIHIYCMFMKAGVTDLLPPPAMCRKFWQHAPSREGATTTTPWQLKDVFKQPVCPKPTND